MYNTCYHGYMYELKYLNTFPSESILMVGGVFVYNATVIYTLNKLLFLLLKRQWFI